MNEKPCPKCGGLGKIYDWSQWGERIRKARKELNITQIRFSTDLGIQCSYLGRLERGEVNFIPFELRARIDGELGTGDGVMR